jgi:hypothetical protein
MKHITSPATTAHFVRWTRKPLRGSLAGADSVMWPDRVLDEFLYLAFFSWIVFFGGAERIENTFFGYLEFGVAGERAIYIKFAAWLGLFVGLVLYFF